MSTSPALDSPGHPRQVKAASHGAPRGASSNPADSRAPSPPTVRTQVCTLAHGPEESHNSPLPSPQQRRLPNGCAISAHRDHRRGPAWRAHLAVPSAAAEGRAGGSGQGQRGGTGRPGRRRGRGVAGPAGTHLRSGPAAILVEQEGGRQQQQPNAEPGPHGGAPGAAAAGGRRRRSGAGRSRAAAGGSLSEGRGAGAARSPGRGGLRLRPERRQASSPICWPCPLPSAARVRRLRGVDSAARVRGSGSARAEDCGCRAPGRQDFAVLSQWRRRRNPASPRSPAARRTEGGGAGPQARAPGARAGSGAAGVPRASASGPKVRATPGRRDAGRGQELGEPWLDASEREGGWGPSSRD